MLKKYTWAISSYSQRRWLGLARVMGVCDELVVSVFEDVVRLREALVQDYSQPPNFVCRQLARTL